MKEVKLDTFSVIFYIFLFIVCVFCGTLGIVEKQEQKKEKIENEKIAKIEKEKKEKEEAEKEKAYINRAKIEENLIKENWNKNNPTYKISFDYSENNNDFIIFIDIPEEDYNKYITYSENEDVKKTWSKLLNTLKESSLEGYDDFAKENIQVNYYFQIKNPTNENEMLGIVKNGEIIKDFMNP